MLLTLLSLTCQRAQAQAPELSNLIHAMRVKDAAGIGRRRLERNGRDTGTPQEGALLGRSLLLVGMEEAASEVFHQQLKAYDQVSRSNVRWQSALDQAWLFHHLNKPARAVACWSIVAGDHEAPLELRVEGHCGKALSLQALGQHAEALATARQAEALCQSAGAAMLEPLARAIRLEVLARVHLLRHEELTDHALSESAMALARDLPTTAEMVAELAALESSTHVPELLRARLAYLRCGLLGHHPASRQEAVASFVRWLREHELAGLESQVRVEACLALLTDKAATGARDVIQPLASVEREVDRHPYASDIQYCLSKIHMEEGRLGESLRQYKRHVAQAMRVVHNTVLARMNSAASTLPSQAQDTTGLRLPPRYRAAYRYIVEHLHDANLSVREIAGRLGVTERALQLAFRNHLGMTPAELIRTERVKRIEDELREMSETGGRAHMLDVASRWGICNRSTLANAFKLSAGRPANAH
ncbi:helix-turn-helix domain-containing protein [Acidovorax sp. SUPP2522]|uniref:helix-turn-helix domain-containing protein n=1 Tax=unclassified Acidovorax TaxID=2684926 RepID=UPI00234A1793|nr:MULTISPECIES: helix-turn-helix domain-containing protein [unclassified Acidovorax]WCM97331.1 helix-turn-helix domain-containing protein [Acidovorax sp. GBBC 1281]GKT18800.1 helix-turn-helix domain-containing protein [Acidovorax sp. SUPP2522]